MLPQYSDKTSKIKSDSRLDKISNTIKGEFFYSTGELLCASLSGGFARTQIIERCTYNLEEELALRDRPCAAIAPRYC